MPSFAPMELAGSKTAEYLREAFAAESASAARNLYFAQKADTEGHNEIAVALRSVAEGCLSQAHGHLEYLQALGDPVTGEPLGHTTDNLRAALAEQEAFGKDRYREMASQAKKDGLGEIADWFKRLAETEKNHSRVFSEALDELGDD